MQKALVQMNVQLPLVVSDITGVTGLKILGDIVAGRTDPHALAQHRDYRCHASEAEIVAALTGNYRPEHVFVLRQNLEAFDHIQQQLAGCDTTIAAHLQQTGLGAFYRRLAFRVGKAKAVTATARKLAILVYHTLKGDLVYQDPGADAYEVRDRVRVPRRPQRGPVGFKPRRPVPGAPAP